MGARRRAVRAVGKLNLDKFFGPRKSSLGGTVGRGFAWSEKVVSSETCKAGRRVRQGAKSGKEHEGSEEPRGLGIIGAAWGCW